MSKTSNKQKLDCLKVWLEWFKKNPGYPRKKHKSREVES
jgi:hypothetical protein